MTRVIEYFDVSLFSGALAETEEFFCGTEYEIEDVKTIKLPGHGIYNRKDLSLSDSSAHWLGDIGLMHDGSLRNNGMEFITKPVNYERALQLFDTLHTGLVTGPEPFSPRTSIHVHVNMANMTLDQLKHFLLTYVLLEPVFFEVAGETRKHNIHCVPLTYTILPTIYCKSIVEIVKSWSKYSAFNLLPIKTQGTVEFRHLYGTNDAYIYRKWLTLIKELWDFVNENETNILQEMLLKGLTPQEIQHIVLPSSKDITADFSDSFIDVKLAF